MRAFTPLFLAAFIGLSPAVNAQEESEPIEEGLVEFIFIREEYSSSPYYKDELADRTERLKHAAWLQEKIEGIRRQTPALSPDEMEYLRTEVEEIGQLTDRARQRIRFNALFAKGLHHRQKVRSQCHDMLYHLMIIQSERISAQQEMYRWIALHSELGKTDIISDAVEFMEAKGYWEKNPVAIEAIRKAWAGNIVKDVIAPAAWVYAASLDKESASTDEPEE